MEERERGKEGERKKEGEEEGVRRKGRGKRNQRRQETVEQRGGKKRRRGRKGDFIHQTSHDFNNLLSCNPKENRFSYRTCLIKQAKSTYNFLKSLFHVGKKSFI